jgi:hypothetical protein
MPDDKKRMPKWARRVLLVASIVAPISGASVTGFKACYEIKAAKKVANQAKVEAAETQEKADDGYDTFGPAITELQNVLNTAQEWAATTDEDLDNYGDRLERCEGYMEKLSRRRGFPKMPELEDEYDEGPWYETPVVSMVVPAMPSGDPAKRPKKIIKAMRTIPDSLEGASDYQQQRAKEHCAPDDPLCGAEAFKKALLE